MSEQPKLQVTKRVAVVGDQGMVRLQMWISAASPEIPPELFVFQRIGTVPRADFPTDQFVHIASYADIAAFPIGAPDIYAPYFRQNGADLTFPTRGLLEQTWELCRAHLQLTVEDITRIDGLPPAEIEVVSL
jgi:hypothetical protein